MGVGLVGITEEAHRKGLKNSTTARVVKNQLVKQMDKLAQVADSASTFVRGYLEQSHPSPKFGGKSRLLVMTDAMFNRACAGDTRAAALLLDRAYSKPAMAAADREAGRPILQMNNNQIVAQQAPASSEPAPMRPTITLPASLPTLTETSTETNKTSENV